MSEAIDELKGQSELDALRAQCKLLGITFHHKHKEDKLIELIDEHTKATNPVNLDDANKPLTENDLKNMIRRRCLKMHRIMVTCNDPMKMEYPGEIFQAGNAYVSTVKKFVPFGNENGWHMPQILITAIEEKVFRRPAKDGRNPVSGGLHKAYIVTKLDDLTPEEFQALRHQQELRKAQQ